MATYVATKDSIERKWLVIDAEGMVLGRLATEVAKLLRGKHKPTYTPFLDTGDNVIVINASKIVLTGKKLDDKLYRHHSGFPGGLKEIDYRTLMAKNPEKALELAVKGMLPKNSLGRQMFRKLHVYAGPEHEQTALVPGKGKITINGKDIDDYFGLDTLKLIVRQPLAATQTEDKFDVIVKAIGGGISGQAGAIRHGIARALVEADEESYKAVLKESGFLTRDARMKERKKPGLKKARKASQFSKR